MEKASSPPLLTWPHAPLQYGSLGVGRKGAFLGCWEIWQFQPETPQGAGHSLLRRIGGGGVLGQEASGLAGRRGERREVSLARWRALSCRAPGSSLRFSPPPPPPHSWKAAALEETSRGKGSVSFPLQHKPPTRGMFEYSGARRPSPEGAYYYCQGKKAGQGRQPARLAAAFLGRGPPGMVALPRPFPRIWGGAACLGWVQQNILKIV